jgi:MHS family alpha-ketoglutarate permease-like MFS transporter
MATAPILDRSSDEHVDFADMRRRIKAIFIGSVGNLVEWYDFYAYAAFALYFAGAFFPNSDPVVQQLNAALLFAAGFLVRPLAGGCSVTSPITTDAVEPLCFPSR